MKPKSEAFDRGAKPINVDNSNLVWLDASDIRWIKQSQTTTASAGIKMSLLWGSTEEGQLSGKLLRIPAGVRGKIESSGTIFHGIVIKGSPNYNGHRLEPGSYFGGTGNADYLISSDSEQDSTIYIRSDAKLEVMQIDSPT